MEEKGIIGTIFDFSFDSFITTKVIKFLLGLAMVLVAIGTIIIIVGGFQSVWWKGVLALILSPVIYVIWMLFVRINLELIIVAFRIVEHLGSIDNALGKKAPEPSEK